MDDDITRIRPKLAWRLGLVVLIAALVVFGASRGAYTIAALLTLWAVYAWTTTLAVFPDAIEKRNWGVGRERTTRPVRELDFIHVSTIGRRAIEIGPIGASVTLELGFWNKRHLATLVRELVAEAETLGDDSLCARILRYAGAG